ncbi:elongation factor 1-delta-like isoform X2 [Rhopilema esculentum]|uniref:elongation factor 1-delta-like isoform X2 n=1 Tax=Rhopilema esculentum TaxID=499914 RepID=UPI0031E2829B
MTGTEMMQESIWFEKPKYEEAEAQYQLHLAGESGSGGKAPGSGTTVSDNTVAALQKENNELRQMVLMLTKKMNELELRVNKIEGTKPSVKEESAKPKEEDDDFDLFDSESEEDEKEDDTERKKLLEKYHEKKSKKPALVPKSNILLDVKPWADDTDLEEMERLVRGIKTDGLVWGASKLVPVAFGIKKLQIACVVEDEKVGTDFLEEAITEFEDHVQSVDVAAFNKV